MFRNNHVFRSFDGAFPTVGVRGASAHTYGQQIFDVIENQFSLEYRQLFAEPVVDDASKRIDWWSDLEGPVESFSNLPDSQKSAFRIEIADRFEAIRDRAAVLRRSGHGDAMLIAELLSAIVIMPSEATWFSVGGRPVITLWAHEQNEPNALSDRNFVKAAGTAIMAEAEAEAPGYTIPKSVNVAQDPLGQPELASRGFWAAVSAWLLAIPAWLRWLILLLLLLILLSWLLRSCVPNFDPFSLEASDWQTLDTDTSGESAPPETEPQMLSGSVPEGPGDRSTSSPPVLSVGGNTLVPPPLAVQPGVTLVPGVGSLGASGGGQTPAPLPQAQIVIQVDEARAREAQLRAVIARLEAQIAARQEQCTPAVCGPDGAPLPSSLAPATTMPTKPVAATPEPMPEQPVKPHSETQPQPQLDTRLEPPKDKTAQPEPSPAPDANSEPQPVNCLAPRPAWEAPEIVVVIDTSGSMALPSSMSAIRRHALLTREQNGDQSAAREVSRLSTGGGRKLMDDAKDAIVNMVTKMPEDVDIGYIEFGECKGVLNHSFYPNDRRGELLGKIDAARPQKGTPLARAIERAGNIIQGESVDEKGTIVVVADGYDSCGGDPCAAARAIAQSKPGVTINVVNLGPGQRVQCISQNGRGRTITADEASLRHAIIQASEEPPIPENCR